MSASSSGVGIDEELDGVSLHIQKKKKKKSKKTLRLLIYSGSTRRRLRSIGVGVVFGSLFCRHVQWGEKKIKCVHTYIDDNEPRINFSDLLSSSMCGSSLFLFVHFACFKKKVKTHNWGPVERLSQPRGER